MKSPNHFQLDLMVPFVVMLFSYENHLDRLQIGDGFLELDGLPVRESEESLVSRP